MKVRVAVRLKPAILDPQGKTVLNALHQLGYDEIKSVRIGKLIELEVEAANEEVLQQRLDEVSRKVLTNPLMETYDIDTDA